MYLQHIVRKNFEFPFSAVKTGVFVQVKQRSAERSCFNPRFFSLIAKQKAGAVQRLVKESD